MSVSVGENQDRVCDFLADPALHGGAKVSRIDTHANILLIGGETAYKLKRAIKYPFLDYSTLELRYKFCVSEILLNRRTAPDLYLGVAPILIDRSTDTIRLGDLITRPDPDAAMPASKDSPKTADDIVEWAIVMKRFDDSKLLDRLASEGALDPVMMEEVADALATFHKEAAPVKNNWAAIKQDVLDGNLTDLAAASFLDQAQLKAHASRARALLDKLMPHLNPRVETGHVRQCHGDVHLRNICMIDQHPVLFDCIEFNDDFSQIDCLYDLAFLLMDLFHRGLGGFACDVVNSYMEATGDYEGVALLPFYMMLRAQIRAKIEVSTAQFAPDAAARARHEAEAVAYLSLADRLITGPAARLIAIGGASGSGKSTVAQTLGRHMAQDSATLPLILRSDAIRKAEFGVPLRQKLPQEAYRTEVSVKVYEKMERTAQLLLQGGATVILDATFTNAGSRERVEVVAEAAGVPFDGLWLDVPEAVLVARVDAREGDVSDADRAVVLRQLRQDWGDISWIRISGSQSAEDTSRKTPRPDPNDVAPVLEEVRRALSI